MAQNARVPRIVELARIIADTTEKLNDTLSSQNIPTPSFDAEYTKFPENAIGDQETILNATSELYDLLLDPLSALFQYGSHNNMVSLQMVSRYKIANLVPTSGSVSYDELSERSHVSKDVLQRLLRHAMTRHIFREPEPGRVSHTASSRVLVQQHMNDWMSVGSEVMWPAAVKMLDAAEKWPYSAEPHETAFSLANGGTGSAYEVIGADPVLAARFASAMKAYTSSPGFDVAHVIDNYDWAALGSALVVDVGGARGHVAMALAEKFEGLRFLVQDMAQVVAGAEEEVAEEVRGRIAFEAHDLFVPQTVEADVFYLRWILHNWSDKYCVMILQALVPVLKPGGRVLIQDTLMPEPGGMASWKEMDLRSTDLNMWAVFNARERTVVEWTDLLKKADSRFEVHDIFLPVGSALALIDVRWNCAP
ncbi:sterigmatocystin 8-O-methyltransferase [Corynespora cassiicola Philippines]|uniref:Sterigmatocystin 8-O-methyltransferase n=1 Tax=Corynespora cassiicola Philippines TaxID=1448308 RepID=A0A2T2P2C6_CORCC|nr:sterigmatocystin 8-O-methyltransferase [Corynespora cassiicola Philippines]